MVAAVLCTGVLFLGSPCFLLALQGLFYQYLRSVCYHRRSDTLSINPSLGDGSYHWQSSIGRVGSHGVSNFPAPKNLSAVKAWDWAAPSGRFATSGLGGSLIDDQSNVYVFANYATLKLSPDGHTLWTYLFPSHCGVIPQRGHPTIQPNLPFADPPLHLAMNSGALWGGAVYGSTERGQAYAIDMATGAEIWSSQFTLELGAGYGMVNNGFTTVHDGVVVCDAYFKVSALDAITGALLWDFKPDAPTWNFLASYPGDGTVVFQDIEGSVYKLLLRRGTPLWKSPGAKGTWSDGSATVGSNGKIYAVNNQWGHDYPAPADSWQAFANNFEIGRRGEIRAISPATGAVLWRYPTEKPANNVPAIGRLKGRTDLSVVVPIGLQDVQGEVYYILALDAATGEVQWTFTGPTQVGPRQAMGDLSASERQRQASAIGCIPNPWSAPTIDSNGIVVIANQEGQIYTLADENGDGKVEGPEEVDYFDTWRGFCGSSSPAISPGLMVVASCDSVHGFRWKP